jgi:hypothetical protein
MNELQMGMILIILVCFMGILSILRSMLRNWLKKN